LSGISAYLVIESIIDYFAYGVTTTSRSIQENPTIFPKVTFCNLKLFSTKYAFDLWKNGKQDGINLTNKQRTKLGHDLNDILLQCSFNGKKCDSTDFIWSFDFSYGNCYMFNSGFKSNGSRVDLKRSNVANKELGLQLTIYANIYEEFLDVMDKNGLNQMGVIIRIGNSSYMRDYSNDGILVSPGFQTNIVVDREFKSMLPKPYSNCEIDSTSPNILKDMFYYNLIGESNYEYSQQLCLTQCVQVFFINQYNCTLSVILSLKNSNNLSCNFTLIDSLFDSYLISRTINDCLPSCPLECHQTLYKTSISFSYLLSNRFLPFIKNNSNLITDFLNRTLDATTAKDSFVNVNIYYESLSYTESNESPRMDVISLLASIGGNLSLFLGVSVFSLCEVIEVLIETFHIVINRKIKVSSEV
jgi:hypothetical protein